MRARITGQTEQAGELEDEYERLSKILSSSATTSTTSSQQKQTPIVHVLSSIDAQGRLIDIGSDDLSSADNINAGGDRDAKRRRIKDETRKMNTSTHDSKTGHRLAYSHDDTAAESRSVAQMLLEERIGGGGGDEGLAEAIVRDARFSSGLEYLDEVAEGLAGRASKALSETRKRQIAIQGK